MFVLTDFCIGGGGGGLIPQHDPHVIHYTDCISSTVRNPTRFTKIMRRIQGHFGPAHQKCGGLTTVEVNLQ